VEIFLNMRRIALHLRSPRRNGYSTKEEHMPESHLRYKQTKGWDADYFIFLVSGVIRGPKSTDLQVGDRGIFKFDDVKQIL
jgi:hypothetical protein